MSNEPERAVIAKIQGQITKLQSDIKAHKTTINSLCLMIGDEPLYSDAADEITGGAMVTRSDEFYGKPMATVVRTIMERRKSINLGAVSVPELYRVMKEGGYLFEAKNEDNARRGIHIALSKNQVFHRLPQGEYGLREWYPAIKDRAKLDHANGVRDKADKPDEEEIPLHDELKRNTKQEAEQAGDESPKQPAKAR